MNSWAALWALSLRSIPSYLPNPSVASFKRISEHHSSLYLAPWFDFRHRYEIPQRNHVIRWDTRAMHPKSPNRTDTFWVIYCKSYNRKVKKHSNLDFNILILQSDKKEEKKIMANTVKLWGMTNLSMACLALKVCHLSNLGRHFTLHKWLVDVVKSCNNVKLL